MNSKNIDYKNFVEKEPIDSGNCLADKPDILVDLLDKEIERKFLNEKCEVPEKAHSDDGMLVSTENEPLSHSGNDFVDFSAIFQLPLVENTTSLPPCITTDDYDSSNYNINHSKSIDTIYSVTSNLNAGWNPNNIEHKSENTLNPIPANNQVLSDASTISLDLVTLSKHKKSSDSSPSNKSPVKKTCDDEENKKQTPDIIEGNINNNKSTNGILTTSKTYRSPTDENGGDFNAGLVQRKRQSSTVTYNVNVINFQNENPSMTGPDDEHYGQHDRGYGGRSNSSTSKIFQLIFYLF
jgi:hypothetical protein